MKENLLVYISLQTNQQFFWIEGMPRSDLLTLILNMHPIVNPLNNKNMSHQSLNAQWVKGKERELERKVYRKIFVVIASIIALVILYLLLCQ